MMAGPKEDEFCDPGLMSSHDVISLCLSHVSLDGEGPEGRGGKEAGGEDNTTREECLKTHKNKYQKTCWPKWTPYAELPIVITTIVTVTASFYIRVALT